MPNVYELATIGAGNMAEGVVRGVVGAGVIAREQIIAVDPDPARREQFNQQLGVAATFDVPRAVDQSRVVLLAVKPQAFAGVAAELAGRVRADHLVVSIMAGVSTAKIEAALAPTAVRVVRVMPNLPMIVGAGMAGFCAGARATADDLAFVKRVFESAGRAVQINDEALMDAVTAVSGSGPAYYYLFTAALIEGGRRVGLDEATARLLAAQTCLGAARMMLERGEPPHELRAKVTSKGGTTAAALAVLESGGVPEQIARAVVAAFERGRALGAQG